MYAEILVNVTRPLLMLRLGVTRPCISFKVRNEHPRKTKRKETQHTKKSPVGFVLKTRNNHFRTGKACAPCAVVGSGSCGGVACEKAEEEEDEEKESVTEMLFFFFFLGRLYSLKYTYRQDPRTQPRTCR